MSQLIFDDLTDRSNLLPFDGEVFYYGKQYAYDEAQLMFNALLHHIQWENDQVHLFGKTHITDRKVAFYGNSRCKYNYSGKTHLSLPWTNELIKLKYLTEELTQARYNACLLNLYHSGKEAMGWHADNEREMKVGGSIASWSFGAERPFSFKHRSSGTKRELLLEHGSLLEMKGETQLFWLHQLPKRLRIHTPRINVTFREMLEY